MAAKIATIAMITISSISVKPESLRIIEAPRSPAKAGRRIFDRKEVCYFQIRSLTPQSANPPERFGGLADGECARFCGSILMLNNHPD